MRTFVRVRLPPRVFRAEGRGCAPGTRRDDAEVLS